MQVIIHDLVSNVRTVDTDSVLAPATLARIVAAVLKAVREDADHQARIVEEHALENYQELTQKRRWIRP